MYPSPRTRSSLINVFAVCVMCVSTASGLAQAPPPFHTARSSGEPTAAVAAARRFRLRRPPPAGRIRGPVRADRTCCSWSVSTLAGHAALGVHRLSMRGTLIRRIASCSAPSSRGRADPAALTSLRRGVAFLPAVLVRGREEGGGGRSTASPAAWIPGIVRVEGTVYVHRPTRLVPRSPRLSPLLCRETTETARRMPRQTPEAAARPNGQSTIWRAHCKP